MTRDEFRTCHGAIDALGYSYGVKAIAWGLLGVGLGFFFVVLYYGLTGTPEPHPSFLVGGCACLAIAAALFIVDRRRTRPAA